MADRYWVGGTATWNATAGSNWATSSGGAGGASLPTSTDDVFFDAASGGGTVTLSTGNTGAKSLNFTGFAGTLAGTGAISVAGSVTLGASMTRTHTGAVSITAAATLTGNGKSFGNLTINAPAATVLLADALAVDATLTLTAGTLDAATNDVNVTCANFAASGSVARQLDMGDGTWSLTGTGIIWTVATATNLTFNRHNAVINITNTSGTAKSFTGSGQTYGAVNFIGAQLGVTTIAGSNTFGAVSIDAGCEIALPAGGFTTFASLSVGDSMDGNMTYIHSATRGTNALLTITAGAALEGAALQDITISGGGAVSITDGANLRGNVGVTFVSGTAAIVDAIEALPDAAAITTIVNAARDNVLTAVGDVPTNAELATALAAADDAVLAQVALVKAKTDNLPSDPADQSLLIAAIAGVSVDLSPVTTAIADLPTNAELATALGGIAVDLTPVLEAIDEIDVSIDAGAIADAVWDEALAAHAGAGSAGQALGAVGASADPLLNTVPGTYASGTAGAALGRIASGQITTVSPVAQGGSVEVFRGDDYDADDGRALEWTDAGGAWPVLTGATISVLLGSNSFSGSVVTATGDAKKVRLELSAAQTSGLRPGKHPYRVRAAVGGDTLTLVMGTWTVK